PATARRDTALAQDSGRRRARQRPRDGRVQERRTRLRVHAAQEGEGVMKNKLLIVTDIGLLKAYKVGLTPKHTPRLQPLEDVVLEEAHHRVIEMVTHVAGRKVAPTK